MDKYNLNRLVQNKLVYDIHQMVAPVVGNHGKLGPCPRPWRGGGMVR